MGSGDEDLPDEDPTDIGTRPPDDYVERNLPKTTGSTAEGLTLGGVLGESDREGFGRLYLGAALDRYAEFRTSDVVNVGDVAEEEQPMVGERATSVTLRPGARIDVTRTHNSDDLDIDFSPFPLAEYEAFPFPWPITVEWCWTGRWYCSWPQ
jgi:hypothetical protein